MNEKEKEELEKFSKLFDDYINDEVYNGRPRRYDDLYVNMEKVEDYEYTYVLAYELSQRNERVKDHFKKAEYYKENLEEYYETLNQTDFFRDSIDLGYSDFLVEQDNFSNKNSFFEIIDPVLTLNDIKRFGHDVDIEPIGLWKLIAYLIDSNNLYHRSDNRLMDIKEAEESICHIMENPHEYAAYCKVKGREQREFTSLSKDMPLEILDEAFLNDLSIIRTPNKIPHAKISYSVPTLRFKNEKVVYIPINLNLDKQELQKYIFKIKDDFDNNKDILKSSLEIFGEALIDAKKPKNHKKHASKKDFADAIYIYDLYKYIENIYVKKLNKNIDRSQRNLHQEVSLASGISKVHNYFLEHGTTMQSKNKKSDDLKKSDTIEGLYKVMREYINDEKYKELITGSKVKEIKSMWDRIPTSPLYSITLDELHKT